MTDVYTICPICGKEFKFEDSLYDYKLETHFKDDHAKEEVSRQLGYLWFGMAQQVVRDDAYVRDIVQPKMESNLHEANKKRTRADTLSKLMNDYRLYKR